MRLMRWVGGGGRGLEEVLMVMVMVTSWRGGGEVLIWRS